jgi:ribosomal-protein-alanine N-acetyltransferase
MARIILRAPTPDDEDAFLAAMRRSRTDHRPYLYPPQDGEAYRAYLARLDERKYGYLACRRDDGAIVGWLNVSEIVRGALQGAFLGYGGVSEHAGQGYMTEAVKLVLREAFGPLGLHRLEANIQPDNHASIALVKRCGFEKEGFSPRYLKIAGRWRDHERWAILSDEWKPGAALSPAAAT